MPSSRYFLGTLIPNATNMDATYSVDSNGLSMIMENVSPASSGGSWEFSVVAISAAANTFTARTAIAATLTTQGLTLTAVVAAAGTGAAGNSITVAFTGGGTAGAEVVTVVGTAISVQIESGVSTVTQVRTAMQAAPACTALVTTTGTSASTVTTAAAVPLAGGVNTQFDLTTGLITSTAVSGTHFPGQLGRLTISAGSLPTGLATATDYYEYFPNALANTRTSSTVSQFQLFSSIATLNAAKQTYRNGIAPPGTPGLIIPTADGTAGSTMTFTPTAVASGTITYQQSNDFVPSGKPVTLGSNFNIGSNSTSSSFQNMPTGLTFDAAATKTTNTVAVSIATYRAGCGRFVNLALTISAGSMLVRCVGYNA